MGRFWIGRTRALGVCGAVAALLLGAPALAAAKKAPTGAAPCTAASDACTEWVTLDKAGARSLIYRSFPLTRPNAHSEPIWAIFSVMSWLGQKASSAAAIRLTRARSSVTSPAGTP